jgi:hypothetical protein
LGRSKKNISAFVLLALVITPMAILLCNQVKQMMVAQYMIEELEAGKAHRMAFLLSNIIWIEEEREISVNNQLIDIKTYQIVKDSIVLTGLYDKEETQLKKEINDLLGKKTDAGQHSFLLKLMFSCYLPVTNNYNLYPVSYCSHTSNHLREKIITVCLPVPDPPPNLTV